MPNTSSNNNRIIKNTILLYSRMLITMVISLYTSRIILQTLGVEDYGIYTVVGGVVAMFSILTNSLSVAISRFITFELGKSNLNKLKDVFSNAVIILLILSVIIILLAETIGIYFLNNDMNIPINRIGAANWVFQLSIITFTINLISVPYNAIIFAYEKMSAFAYISIFDVFGKLLIAYLIINSPIDKLVFYALLTCILSLIIRYIYLFYCKRNFKECNFKIAFNKELFKQMFSFASWNFIGASSGILRDQGINILLNIFCGTTVNAARGIAMQVNTAVSHFVNNFTTAINPQIIKSYAEENYDYLMKLVFQGARFTFYLLFIISLPILIETPTILNVWLKLVPDYTIIFVRLIIIYTMTESISYSMVTLMLATGNIRNYQIIVGGCQMLNFPVAYILLKLKFSPEYTIISSIIIAVACLSLRLYMLNKMVNLSIKDYLNNVLLNILKVAFFASIPPLLIVYNFSDSFTRLIFSAIICTLSASLSILFVGCKKNERIFILNKIRINRNNENQQKER